MIVVIDYDIGNLASVVKAFEYLNVPVKLSSDYRALAEASGIVLPGVGAFGEGMENLKRLKLEKRIIEEVRTGKPFFGICLGMQLLFSSSEECQETAGLGLIEGEVKLFDRNKVGKVPHIGWNQVEIIKKDQVFDGLNGENFYFVHSYYVKPVRDDVILGKTNYGNQTFAAVVRRDNVWGMQCHPEKSSQVGLSVLRNFSGVVLNANNSSN
ncbi:imidazole glycerol phosphate synthase subunit HisH [Halocella sp. SP3-1]|uniref:imidazole glycerol phosphate synthase subunit HisH n=1 Tax=Halocella sp. SP3-1 TaxID=2382161 RepID=UPI000F74EE51|nr:imidazole glycerol phosphate synthase subunit HisH [Halocella sp. SP3-1]AZO96276.1 imidazole glycerol phosphate synthase subunit HisH [Halocella sp. SP3-1]